MGVRDFHPKMKGNLGEAKVAAELIGRGYPVFMEFGDLSRVDMIVEAKPGWMVRVQVKCYRSKRGAVMVRSEKSGPGYRYRYREDDVDLFAVYVYDRDVLLYIPSSVICARRCHTSFRLDPPRNRQTTRIRAASDFVDFEEALRKIGGVAPVA